MTPAEFLSINHLHALDLGSPPEGRLRSNRGNGREENYEPVN
jgi:hypothetical protein